MIKISCMTEWFVLCHAVDVNVEMQSVSLQREVLFLYYQQQQCV